MRRPGPASRRAPSGGRGRRPRYDGLLSTDYLPELAAQLPASWALFQPLLTSGYCGFGVGSLDRDAAELRELLRCLLAEHGVAEVAVLGFSTGAQDAVHLLRRQVWPASSRRARGGATGSTR